MSISTISSNSDSPNSRAHDAEREANRQIDSARKRVEQVNHEADVSIEHIKDEYQKRVLSESLRNANTLETEKTKGYEQLRDLHRGQQSQQRKALREGERDLSHLKEHYRNQVHQEELHGSQQLRDIQRQFHHQVEHERDTSNDQLAEIKTQNEQAATHIKKTSEDQIQKLNSTAQTQFEELRTRSEEVKERLNKKYDEQVKNVALEREEKFNQIQSHATQQIKEIRKDTADKLAAYRSRQNDPFYKLMDLNAHFAETRDGYVLTAQIPEYEQQHISASVKGNNLVLSGFRRNEETLDLGEGHKKGTSSFQSFHESFPLKWPVEAKKLTRESDGDTIIIQVPKKNEYVYQTPPLKRPEKTRAEPPRFPQNIKLPHADAPKETDEDPKPSRPKPGSGTLA